MTKKAPHILDVWNMFAFRWWLSKSSHSLCFFFGILDVSKVRSTCRLRLRLSLVDGRKHECNRAEWLFLNRKDNKSVRLFLSIGKKERKIHSNARRVRVELGDGWQKKCNINKNVVNATTTIRTRFLIHPNCFVCSLL